MLIAQLRSRYKPVAIIWLIVMGLTLKMILRVHHVSKQHEHYDIGFLNAQEEILLDNVCLGTTNGC